MSAASRLRQFYLSYFSKPRHDRALYRALARKPALRIVEMGLQTGLRSQRLIEVALRYAGGKTVEYTGIDLFEARPAEQPRISLKQAYLTLRPLGATVRLVPGDPFMALARAANQLVGSDLLVISADQDPESLKKAWFYVPRMLGPETRVFLEEINAGKNSFRPMAASEIESLAKASTPSQRRAA